jgi:surface antigen
MKIKVISFLAAASLALAACEASMPSKQSSGAVLGGVAGGIAGSQIGSGKGRDVAMVVGTLLGAALGGVVGNSMDKTDALTTQQALSTQQTGKTKVWTNPDTQAQYSVTPTRTYENNGQDCRDFTTTVITADGKEESVDGKACRQANGEWKAI